MFCLFSMILRFTASATLTQRLDCQVSACSQSIFDSHTSSEKEPTSRVIPSKGWYMLKLSLFILKLLDGSPPSLHWGFVVMSLGHNPRHDVITKQPISVNCDRRTDIHNLTTSVNNTEPVACEHCWPSAIQAVSVTRHFY